jgi:hypothetical protein
MFGCWPLGLLEGTEKTDTLSISYFVVGAILGCERRKNCRFPRDYGLRFLFLSFPCFHVLRVSNRGMQYDAPVMETTEIAGSTRRVQEAKLCHAFTRCVSKLPSTSALGSAFHSCPKRSTTPGSALCFVRWARISQRESQPAARARRPQSSHRARKNTRERAEHFRNLILQKHTSIKYKQNTVTNVVQALSVSLPHHTASGVPPRAPLQSSGSEAQVESCCKPSDTGDALHAKQPKSRWLNGPLHARRPNDTWLNGQTGALPCTKGK